MNLPSSILFAVIFLAFVFTAHRLLKRVFHIFKNDGSAAGCSCCSGNCSHCNRCAKSAETIRQ
jgi:hypothetical protein